MSTFNDSNMVLSWAGKDLLRGCGLAVSDIKWGGRYWHKIIRTEEGLTYVECYTQEGECLELTLKTGSELLAEIEAMSPTVTSPYTFKSEYIQRYKQAWINKIEKGLN